jgi:hypothetical protein
MAVKIGLKPRIELRVSTNLRLLSQELLQRCQKCPNAKETEPALTTSVDIHQGIVLCNSVAATPGSRV